MGLHIFLNIFQDNVLFFPSIFCISFVGKTIATIQGQQVASTIKTKLMEAFEVSCINITFISIV